MINVHSYPVPWFTLVAFKDAVNLLFVKYFNFHVKIDIYEVYKRL